MLIFYDNSVCMIFLHFTVFFVVCVSFILYHNGAAVSALWLILVEEEMGGSLQFGWCVYSIRVCMTRALKCLPRIFMPFLAYATSIRYASILIYAR